MGQAINSSQILDITRKAGELLKKLSLDPEMRKPRAKDDGSPVTEADQRVSDFIVSALRPMGFPVISEEDLPATPPDPRSPYFLVDPLDGTKYFARGEDEFAVCVGLLVGGEPYLGAIYDPTKSLLYWAERGQGAYCDDQKISHPGVEGGKIAFFAFTRKAASEANDCGGFANWGDP